MTSPTPDNTRPNGRANGHANQYGDGHTDVLRIDDAMPSYADLVSDHRPVVARFAF